MKKWIAATALMLLWADSIRANPIFMRAPASSPGVQVEIAIAALAAESIVVGIHVSRRYWALRAITWFPITLFTFLGFVAAPVITFDWIPNSFHEVVGGNVGFLECLIVILEALILWWIWLRRSGQSLWRALLISAAENTVSYGLSVAVLYYEFIPRRLA